LLGVVILTKTEALNELGLSENYTDEELKKTYRAMARKYHPDVAGLDSTQKFKDIKMAYDLLSSSGFFSRKKVFTHQSIFTIVVK
jgi:DnaJ-class molecular chaperone